MADLHGGALEMSRLAKQRCRDRLVAIVTELPETLIRSDPERFSAGSRGWVALRLDNWAEARELLTDAYRRQALRCLVAS